MLLWQFHLFTDNLVYSEETAVGLRLHRVLQLHQCLLEDMADNGVVNPLFGGADPTLAEQGSTMVSLAAFLPAHAFKVRRRAAVLFDCGAFVSYRVGFVRVAQILSDHKSIIVCARSAAEKAAWMEALSAAIVHARMVTGKSKEEVKAICAPVWVPNRCVDHCMTCQRKFSVAHRRHHCRRCGGLVCGNCSSKRQLLRRVDAERSVRVCDACVTGRSTGKHNLFQVRKGRRKRNQRVASHGGVVAVFCQRGSRLQFTGSRLERAGAFVCGVGVA